MYDHIVSHHQSALPCGDPRTLFGMRRVHVDRDPLRRVVREAIRQRRYLDREEGTKHTIEKASQPEIINVKTVLMNSKEEFHLPRLINVKLSDQIDYA